MFIHTVWPVIEKVISFFSISASTLSALSFSHLIIFLFHGRTHRLAGVTHRGLWRTWGAMLKASIRASCDVDTPLWAGLNGYLGGLMMEASCLMTVVEWLDDGSWLLDNGGWVGWWRWLGGLCWVGERRDDRVKKWIFYWINFENK